MLSARQAAFMRARLPRITIVEGCISSGKTYAGNHKAVEHIVNRYDGGGLIFFVGKTISTLEKNVLQPLAKQYGGFFEYNLGSKRASLCGIRIELEGCNDVRAESKIRGTTAAFVYGDELTLWNREFMVRCMGSLRTPEAVFLGTTNPDAPTNFIKTDYLDRAEELGLWNPRFEMGDNPTLTDEYKRQVSREYIGVLHDRFIKGLWVRAEGVIYPLFANGAERFLADAPPADIVQVNIGVDFGGNKSASVFTAAALTRGFRRVCVVDEEYRPAATEDPETLARAFADFCGRVKAKYPMCVAAYCDSAEQILMRGLQAALRRAGVGVAVRNARKGGTVDRIRLVGSLMGTDRLRILRHCGALVQALKDAVWDPKKQDDTRLDNGSTNVDSLDAFEYALEPWSRQLSAVSAAATAATGVKTGDATGLLENGGIRAN